MSNQQQDHQKAFNIKSTTTSTKSSQCQINNYINKKYSMSNRQNQQKQSMSTQQHQHQKQQQQKVCNVKSTTTTKPPSTGQAVRQSCVT
jgi:hypothetical protein